MGTRLNRDVSDSIDDGAPVAPSSVASPKGTPPKGTPPWMWLARESLPHLPRILQAVARILLALLLGGAALVLALKGQSVPGELLRMVR